MKIIYVTDELHSTIKSKAALAGVTMHRYVAELVAARGRR